MSFVIRCLIVLFLFSFVVYVLKAIARLSHHLRGTMRDVTRLRDQVAGGTPANAEMVRCANCGAFVSIGDALTLSTTNLAQVFCSRECARIHMSK